MTFQLRFTKCVATHFCNRPHFQPESENHAEADEGVNEMPCRQKGAANGNHGFTFLSVSQKQAKMVLICWKQAHYVFKFLSELLQCRRLYSRETLIELCLCTTHAWVCLVLMKQLLIALASCSSGSQTCVEHPPRNRDFRSYIV